MFRRGDIVRSDHNPKLAEEWMDITSVVITSDDDNTEVHAVKRDGRIRSNLGYDTDVLSLELDPDRIMAITKAMEAIEDEF